MDDLILDSVVIHTINALCGAGGISPLYPIRLGSSRTLARGGATRIELIDPTTVRFGVAGHIVELMKLLDSARRAKKSRRDDGAHDRRVVAVRGAMMDGSRAKMPAPPSGFHRRRCSGVRTARAGNGNCKGQAADANKKCRPRPIGIYRVKFVDVGARRARWIVPHLILYVCNPNGKLAASTDPVMGQE